MGNLWQDIRYGLRQLRKSRGFAIVAILTLGLGIGANTAIFTVVNTVFLHPLPVKDPNQLMGIFTTDQRNRGGLNNFLPISQPNAKDVAERAQSFSSVMMFTGTGVSITIDGKPQSFPAGLVSGNFFDVLGVQAELGRTFRPDEDQLGAPGVIVLTHGVWERYFASNPNVIGKNVLLNGQGFTIIGVMPRGFKGTAVLGGPDMWMTMATHDQVLAGVLKEMYSDRRFLNFSAVGRLNSGISIDQARAELKNIGLQLEHDFPTPNKGRSFTVVPLLESTLNPNVQGDAERAGELMMGVVGLVLLIACANISNLLLARAAGRKREISIRLAIGASRTRIITQLLTESILLALAGGIVGLGVAVIARDLLWSFRPPFLQQAINLELKLDGNVLFFTLVISLATGVIFGLLPALQASRPDLSTELKERAGSEMFSGRRFGLRSAFVMLQYALSLIALIGAGLFLVSLRNAQKIEPGFDTHNLGMLSFDLGALNYDPARMREFQRRAIEAAQTLPGVKSVTLATNIPLFGGAGIGRSVFPEGEEGTSTRNGILAVTDNIAPDYFQTLGIPILSGRQFDSSDREDSPKVAIINQAAAHRFWPNQDPIGKRFKFFGLDYFVQVVGVAHDAKFGTLGEEPRPYMYLPLIQTPSPALTLIFRSSGDPRLVLASMRERIQALDRNLPLTNVWPIGEVISQALWGAKFAATLLSIFAGLAMILAAIGVYGVVAYSVGQRVREIGIRMALGARREDILAMIVRQSSFSLVMGLGIGLIAAFALARMITTLLYGVSAGSPIPFALLPVLLASVGLLATYIPARRATKVNPIIALRQEQ
ncbi:MAG TPA: ABC transporter permease [Terriglobales bacterium]|nr:ABC transporter permease [Terriglobales bacterium]